MTQQHTNDSEWLPCPSGELSRLNERVERRERGRTAMKLAAASCTILVVGMMIYGISSVVGTGDRVDMLGGIACRDVRHHAAQFVAGNVDDELKRRIERHLELCPACMQFVRRLKEAQTAVPGPADTAPAFVAAGLGTLGEQRDELGDDILQSPQFALADVPAH